jgi:hypothetical protein
MQLVAEVAGQSAAVAGGNTALDIEGIAQKRMTGCGGVDPYLVRPACSYSDLEQHAAVTPLQDFKVATCGLPRGAGRMKGFQKPMWNRTDWKVDFKFVGGRTAAAQSTVYLQNVTTSPRLQYLGRSFRRNGEQNNA